jgi:hypothetical protein
MREKRCNEKKKIQLEYVDVYLPTYLPHYIIYFMTLSASRNIYCPIEGRWMKYEHTGTDLERSGRGLIEFLFCRAEENHENHNSE